MENPGVYLAKLQVMKENNKYTSEQVVAKFESATSSKWKGHMGNCRSHSCSMATNTEWDWVVLVSIFGDKSTVLHLNSNLRMKRWRCQMSRHVTTCHDMSRLDSCHMLPCPQRLSNAVRRRCSSIIWPKLLSTEAKGPTSSDIFQFHMEKVSLACHSHVTRMSLAWLACHWHITSIHLHSGTNLRTRVKNISAS